MSFPSAGGERARPTAGPLFWQRLLRSALALLAIAVTPACGHTLPPTDSVTVRVSPLPSDELRSAVRLGPGAELVGGWQLGSTDPRFGGLSGLLVDRDRLLVVSDRGWLWTADRAEPNAAEIVVGSWRARDLRLDGRRPDAEALARDDRGRLVVAAEGRHRIARVPTAPVGAAVELVPLPLPAQLSELPANRGIEALATLPDGRLLAIAEAGSDDLHPAAILGGGPPIDLAYRSAPGFAPTGADRSGRWLFVVERSFSPLSGFRARITATPIERIDESSPVIEADIEVARLMGPGLIDNFEGIAAEPTDDADGFRLWLVSDDNFSPLQRTLLIRLDWRPQVLERVSSRRFMRTSSAGSSASPTERR